MADPGELSARRFPSEADVEVLQAMAHRDVMDANQDPSLLNTGQHEYVTALQALAGMATSRLNAEIVEAPHATQQAM